MVKLSDAEPISGEMFFGFYIIVHILFYILWPFRVASLVPLFLFVCFALVLIVFRVGLEIEDNKYDETSKSDVSPLRYVLLAVLQLGFLCITLLPATLLYLWHWKYI
jgi:Ca2+/Na+ antiporter